VSLEPPQLAEATRTADARTLYRRFLGSPPHLTPDPLWLTRPGVGSGWQLR